MTNQKSGFSHAKGTVNRVFQHKLPCEALAGYLQVRINKKQSGAWVLVIFKVLEVIIMLFQE